MRVFLLAARVPAFRAKGVAVGREWDIAFELSKFGLLLSSFVSDISAQMDVMYHRFKMKMKIDRERHVVYIWKWAHEKTRVETINPYLSLPPPAFTTRYPTGDNVRVAISRGFENGINTPCLLNSLHSLYFLELPLHSILALTCSAIDFSSS